MEESASSPFRRAGDLRCPLWTAELLLRRERGFATRSYDEELALARTLVRDPASSGMRDVRLTEVAGIGQAAFSESGYVLQQQQNIAYVVWRSGSRAWVLTLAEAARTGNSSRLGSVAKQIDPRLPR